MQYPLSGRINSNNAAEVEKKLFEEIGETSDPIVLDFEDVEYISSAGLRVILKAKKKYKNVSIENASTEVYEVFEMTGMTQMMNVSKAYKKYSTEGLSIVDEGAKGIIYRLNQDTIVKVYKNNDSLPSIMKERNLAKKAFIMGVPTAISYDVAKVGDNYASVFELLDCKSLSQIIRDDSANLPKHVSMFTELLKQIHEIEVDDDEIPDFKDMVLSWIEVTIKYLPEAVGNKLLDLVKDFSYTPTLIHGDYHTNNIMVQDGEAILIDMDTLSKGHPIFELANVYITFVGFGEINPEIVEKFLRLPYDTAKQIWTHFLPEYLGTDDTKEVENKIKILAYTRFIRHTARRDDSTEEAKKTISYCADQICSLIDDIDSLSI